jgi:transcriptional regulator
MYIPLQYQNKNLNEVKDFLKENAFAILISQVDNRPWATHLPLELETDPEGTEVLTGHVARRNPQWRYFKEQEQVLAIFNGPHAYISSSWYRDEEVPTWNYVAVHVYGSLRILDEEEVMASLHRLVDKYEAQSAYPISLKDMSEQTLRQVRGVVGFQIRIEEIHAAFKLSQGREQDHTRIIKELQQRNQAGDADIIRHMSGE